MSWDEALDYVADRLVEIYRRDGPDAMAVYCCAKATNEDNYLLQKMYRAVFRTNNIDHCTRLCHAGSVVALQQALGSSAMSNTASQVLQNDVFIVAGSNTTENHPDHRASDERGRSEARRAHDRRRIRAASSWWISRTCGCR